MPDLNELTHDVTELARDAAYVVVGLAVLGFQRAQVERQQLQRRLATEVPSVDQRLADVRSAVVAGVPAVRSAVAAGVPAVRSAVSTGVPAVKSAVSTGVPAVKSAVSAGVPAVTSAVSAGMPAVRSAVSTGVLRLDELADEVTVMLETALAPLEEQLPAAAREASQKAREQAKVVRVRIRDVVVSVA